MSRETETTQRLNAFFSQLSTIQELPQKYNLAPLIELCLKLTKKAHHDLNTKDQKLISELLNRTVKTIQRIMLAHYEHREPGEETGDELKSLEAEMRILIQKTKIAKPETLISLQQSVKTPVLHEVKATKHFTRSKSSKEFKTFLEQSKNRRPALPYYSENTENAKIAEVKILRPKLKAKKLSSVKPLERALRKFDITQWRKISPQVLLYLFIAYVIFSIWIMMDYKTKIEQVAEKLRLAQVAAVLPASAAPIVSSVVPAPNLAVTSMHKPVQISKEEPILENWFALKQSSNTLLDQKVKITNSHVKVSAEQLKVHFSMNKPNRRKGKINGTFILLTHGPDGIFSFPESAISIREGVLGILPKVGASFSFKHSRIVDEVLVASGSTQVEVFIFNHKNKLLGYKLIKLLK